MNIDGKRIDITNPGKKLWSDAQITKIDYVRYLLEISPYILPYTTDRMLMYWLYPHGIHRPKVEKRSVPKQAPTWIPTTFYKEKDRILLNDKATLVWLGNWEAIELHVPFDKISRPDYPTELVFDLDPSTDDFEPVREIALELKQILDGMSLQSVVKTSGKSGLQVFVPIKPMFRFEETRKVNTFIADYMVEKFSDKLTLDRVKERRGSKLYFDYLQLWRGRTMAVPYSVRATNYASVSTPVTWNEIDRGFIPPDFTMDVVLNRVKKFGDLFKRRNTSTEQNTKHIHEILTFIQTKA